ncbi:metalloprotease PmbA [Halotalea alkalilenta]|uniref:metalloprotease PmbA n=1 Tax=Halotalea alkalilenta TaxID=376489 RepID=UPI000480628E|nr:metalloprotease PmbA [Halotalea alkalilenta]
MSEAFDAKQQQRTLEARVALAVEHAKAKGASACEVGASASQGLEVSVRLGEIDTMELSRDQGIGVTVYFGTRKGSASTSDDSEPSVREAVERACAIAQFTGEDPAAGLADPDRLATEFPDLDLYHPWALSPDEAIALASRCERAGLEVAGIDNSEGASVSSHEGVSVYGNSLGFLQGQRGTRHGFSCVLIARDQVGMQRDYDYSSAREAGQLRDPEEVGRSAAQRALRRLGGRKLATGRYPVLFVPELASGLVGHLLQGIAGGALYRQSSFLCDALGETLFPEWFSLFERPREMRGSASANFDSEGVATRDNRFIDSGRLASYLLSSYSARRLGMSSTGNAGGARNLRISAPLESFEALLAKMSRGVVVTELMGQGVNTVTGDYSRGAAGFWVENGAIQYPVEGFTIAGDLRRMFASLVGIGDDVDRRGNVHSGSWLLEEMMVAG